MGERAACETGVGGAQGAEGPYFAGFWAYVLRLLSVCFAYGIRPDICRASE